MINEATNSKEPQGPNYPPNSKIVKKENEKAEKPKVEKVIQGVAVKRKKSFGRRFVETFTGEDIQSVSQFVFFDVIVPAAKAMISDATSQGVERMLFGEVRRRNSDRRTNFISYNRYSDPRGRAGEPDRPSRRDISRRGRASHDFSEVVLTTRVDAELVLERLEDLINEYGSATVSDFYDLVEISGSFTDDKWGWTNLRDADVRRIREGYIIDLPRPVELR